MTKYKLLFNEMLEKNKELFNEFRTVHDKYALHPEAHQIEFDRVGRKVQNIVRHFENVLCGKSENTGYSQYSSNLAQKFQDEARAHFPKIDFVGVKVSSTTSTAPSSSFTLKKITLI